MSFHPFTRLLRPLLLVLLAGTAQAQQKPLLGHAPRVIDRTVKVQAGGAVPAAYGGASDGLVVDTTKREQSRIFYRTVYAASDDVASGWVGSVAQNIPGTTTQAFKDAILLRVNYFRAMSGVPAAVVFNDAYSTEDQAAALMMSANAQLNHYPPGSWIDYTDDGATAAHSSNLALGMFGPGAIDGYIEDDGEDNTEVGHRRWILCPPTRHMGTGDVDYTAGAGGTTADYPANALWVLDPNGAPSRPATREDFISWPPAGNVPYALVFDRWSLSYQDADFTAASVTMSSGGTAIPVTLAPVDNGYGENTLVWTPQGLDLSAYRSADGVPVGQEKTIHVTVSGVKSGGATKNFAYDVTVIDPQHTGPDTVFPVVSGTDRPTAGTANTYNFAAVPGATGYRWEADTLTPLSLLLGAENGPGNVVVTPATTNVVTTAAHATGSACYQFISYPAVSMMVNTTFVPAAGSNVQFNSRLAWATTDETARVQISSDDGASWKDLYTQTGTGTGQETVFTLRTVDLSAYAGQTCRVRFGYSTLGSYYPAQDITGWFVDDIAISGTQQVNSGALADVPAGGTSFRFTPPAAGSYAMRVRPVFFGSYAVPSLDAVKYTTAVAGGTPAHAAFFSGETALDNGVYYLTFPNGSPFGYYSYLTDPHYLYHFDMGFEYVFDAADGHNGVYFYDFTSGTFFYTSPAFPFPYLYDFTLNSVVYYFPDAANPGHYDTNGYRFFYVFNTGQIISK